ncbi:MAG: ribosome small subunit-dependent GTPase A [Lachnospiraceae bacterium]|nr:ribosome small subunit-dependent GTPase A [Lachnospiraceae bacterium]
MITIKESTYDDIRNIQSLWADEDVMKYIWPGGLHETEDAVREWLDRFINAGPEKNHYSIFEDGKYCGETQYGIDEATHSAALDIKLFKFARGRGIATRALEHSIDEAFKNGAETVWVDPRPNNTKAIALYRRLGFVRKEMPEHVIALGEDPTVFIYMELGKEKRGRICEVQKNSYTIKFMSRELPAVLIRDFYDKEADKLPVVGDYVTFRYNPDGDSRILSVCERKSFLQRPDQSKTGVMQYMVANVDYCFIVTSLNDDYSYNRIARYASVALQGGAIPVAILTKADLCNNVGRYVSEVETISDKIRVHAISALYDIGLDELKEYLTPGTTICLMGSSGAGKSTLLNSLTGEETMKTSAIRESDSKGRHTTTYRQLIELENGVSIIDTPGMREIGMALTEESLDNIFSDILELESRCKFSDCRHDTEPGCAIKKALEDGSLSRERFMLYKNLGSENHRNHAMKKRISILVKQRKKYGLDV